MQTLPIDFIKRGEFNLVHDELLETKYQNRFEVIERLFNDDLPSSSEMLRVLDDPKNPGSVPDLSGIKLSSAYNDHDFLNIAMDAKSLDSSVKTINDFLDSEYVIRKKVYLSDKMLSKIGNLKEQNEGYKISDNIQYFIDMFNDFRPVINQYADDLFPGARIEHELNPSLSLIQYECPFATEESIMQMKEYSTVAWGPEHCDGTLGALHLGENIQEFQARDKNGEYKYVDELMNNHSLWFFGDLSRQYGWDPVYHRMIFNPNDRTFTRYSIIFNLYVKGIMY